MARLLSLLLSVTVLSGCATDNFISYAGPARQASETAVIYGAGTHDHKILKGLDEGVAILQVDGKATSVVPGGNFASKVTVLPGRHVLYARWGYFGKIAEGKLWVECEAGKTYVIQRLVERDRVRLWVEEEGTGNIVGGVLVDE